MNDFHLSSFLNKRSLVVSASLIALIGAFSTPIRAQDTNALSQNTSSEMMIEHPELFSEGEFIVQFKENKTPDAIRIEVKRREQQAQTVLGRIRTTSENISLSLRGEERPEIINEAYKDIESQFNAHIVQPVDELTDTYVYAFSDVQTPDDVKEVVTAYEDLPIEYIQPNYTYYLNAIPADPDFPKQWGHVLIDAPKLWDTRTSSKPAKIAIVDSGIDRNHPDLIQNVVKSAPIAPGCINDGDSNGHGTHIAGVIAATANNSQGIAGLTWDASLYGYCVVSPNGQGNSLTIAQGINQAVADGVDVINMSFGGPIMVGADRAVEEAIQNALDNNISIVVAAGNCGNIPKGQHPDNPACFWGSDADKYMPGAHPQAISVTALGPNSEHPSYANTGSSIDVSAPGGNPPSGSSSCDSNGSNCIFSTWDRFKSCPAGGQTNGYCALSGTSMAAPHVTAIVAYIKSLNLNLTPLEILNLINSSAYDLGSQSDDPIFGYGRVNAQKAFKLALDYTHVPPTITLTPTPSIPQNCLEARKSGDYNCDGFINIVDFEVWRQDFEFDKATIVEFEWFRAGFTK